ncbi:MAG: hypothetical protein AAF491_07165 [Verrucomicrobiota bacterium]
MKPSSQDLASATASNSTEPSPPFGSSESPNQESADSSPGAASAETASAPSKKNSSASLDRSDALNTTIGDSLYEMLKDGKRVSLQPKKDGSLIIRVTKQKASMECELFPDGWESVSKLHEMLSFANGFVNDNLA